MRCGPLPASWRFELDTWLGGLELEVWPGGRTGVLRCVVFRLVLALLSRIPLADTLVIRRKIGNPIKTAMPLPRNPLVL